MYPHQGEERCAFCGFRTDACCDRRFGTYALLKVFRFLRVVGVDQCDVQDCLEMYDEAWRICFHFFSWLESGKFDCSGAGGHPEVPQCMIEGTRASVEQLWENEVNARNLLALLDGNAMHDVMMIGMYG